MSVREAAALAEVLVVKGWDFSVEDGRLRYDAPDGPGFEAELAAVRLNRCAIVAAVVAGLVPARLEGQEGGKEGTTPYQGCPLDPVVAAHFAAKHTLAEIEARIGHLEAQSARPNPDRLTAITLDDWRRIRAAKIRADRDGGHA